MNTLLLTHNKSWSFPQTSLLANSMLLFPAWNSTFIKELTLTSSNSWWLVTLESNGKWKQSIWEWRRNLRCLMMVAQGWKHNGLEYDCCGCFYRTRTVSLQHHLLGRLPMNLQQQFYCSATNMGRRHLRSTMLLCCYQLFNTASRWNLAGLFCGKDNICFFPWWSDISRW